MFRCAISLALLTLSAGSAQGAFFSFASDGDNASWTFRGLGQTVQSAGDPTDPLTLLIDDHNGPLPPLEFNVDFDALFTITHIASTPIGGANFLHTYSLAGDFALRQIPTNQPVIIGSLQGAVLTAVGGENSWHTTASITGGDEFGPVQYTWTAAPRPEYGLFPGNSVGPDDAAFALAVLNRSGILPYDFDPASRGVELGADRYPLTTWWSEGSYDGSARFVPAPGAIALCAVGGVALARRRRAP